MDSTTLIKNKQLERARLESIIQAAMKQAQLCSTQLEQMHSKQKDLGKKKERILSKLLKDVINKHSSSASSTDDGPTPAGKATLTMTFSFKLIFSIPCYVKKIYYALYYHHKVYGFNLLLYHTSLFKN